MQADIDRCPFGKNMALPNDGEIERSRIRIFLSDAAGRAEKGLRPRITRRPGGPRVNSAAMSSKTKIATLDTFRIDLIIGPTSCSEIELALSMRQKRAGVALIGLAPGERLEPPQPFIVCGSSGKGFSESRSARAWEDSSESVTIGRRGGVAAREAKGYEVSDAPASSCVVALSLRHGGMCSQKLYELRWRCCRDV
jgi:hypothetical protein